MKNQKYAVVDLEATVDEQKSQKHIIQIGITFIENGQCIDTLTIDIKPPVAIQPHITELTGITDDRVKHAPIFEDIAQYLQFILSDNIFVAHNVSFDYLLLQEEFQRVGIKDCHLTTLDTLELAQMIYPNEKSYSLSALSEQFNIHLEHHHNAGYDSKATAQLLLQMIDDCHKLPMMLQSLCHYMLQAKQDVYYSFFASQPHIDIYDWVNQYDVLAYKQGEAPFISEESSTTHQAKVILTNQQPNQFGQFAPYIMIGAKNEGDIVLKHKSDFLSVSKLHYCLNHINDLTIQEVRQLVKLCIYLDTNQHRDISSLSLLPKLKYKLINTKTDAYYQKYLTSLDVHANMTTTMQTFVDIEKNNFFHPVLKQHTLVLNNIHYINEQMIKENSNTLPLSDYIWKCFNIKQQWRLSHNVDYVFSLEKCIKTFFSCIHHLRKSYTIIQQKQHSLHEGETCDVYLSGQTEFPDKILLMLKQNMMQLIQLLQQSNHSQLSYFQQQLEYVDTILMNDTLQQYVYLSLTKLDSTMGYTLHFKPLNSSGWITQLKQKVKQIVIVHNGVINDDIKQYAKWVFGEFDCSDRTPVLSAKTLISCCVVDNISRAKDNLIIRKLDAFAKKQMKKTVIILPSQKMIEKMRLYEPSALILENINEKKVWYKLDEQSCVIYMTWQQFVNITIPKDIDYVMLVKLPFDVPNTVFEQAVLQLNEVKTYFSTVQLPKVILQLQSVFEKISEQTQIVVCDERLIYSNYAEKILTILGENYTIVTQTVENLLKQ